MTKTMTTKNGEQLARPLKVLVPLIKQDLIDRKRARDQASGTLDAKIGEELIEAKSQLLHGQWGSWLSKIFHLSQESARIFMRMADAKTLAGVGFSTREEFIRHTQPSRIPRGGAQWHEKVQDNLDRLKVESFNLRQRDLELDEEEGLQRKLAIQLIDIGYKVLSVKLHPDKGGSHDAMQRLNKVRSRLKEVYQ